MRERLLAIAGGVLTSLAVVAAVQAAAETRVVAGRTFVHEDEDWYAVSGSSRTRLLPDRISIRFAPDASSVRTAAIVDSLGLSVLRQGFHGTTHYLLPVGLDPVECYDACSRMRAVEFVEPAFEVTFAATPSDQLWPKQWNLEAGWQDFRGAWDIETGDTTVVIAIIDSGVNLDHPDLRGNLWRNWDEIPTNSADDDSNGFIDDHWGWCFHTDSDTVSDFGGHGTPVTGLVCATTNNDTIGVAGPAGGWCAAGWDTTGRRGNGCLAMTLRIGGVTPEGGGSDEVADALYYAAENGAAIVNMSFAFAVVPEQVAAAVESLAGQGLVMCAAAGNGGTAQVVTVGYPARDSLVIGVGGAHFDDRRAYFSSYGEGLDVIAASGPCLYVEDCYGGESEDCADEWYPDPVPGCEWYPLSTAGGYTRFSGTSAAAPQVSALAGLLKSFDPSLDRNAIKDLICRSAEDQIGDEDDTPGWDERYGWGRINAYQALFLARGGGATTSNLRLCYDVTFDRDVYVSLDDTLTILPGVTVTFTGGSDAANLGVDEGLCELIVEGTLVAVGEDGDEVTFTSDGGSAGSWYGVRVVGEKADAELRHAVVEHAYKGVSAEEPSVLAVAQSVVQECVTHGIYLEGCGSSVEVDTNLVSSPGLIGIEVRECEDLVVRGNRVEDATAYGVKCTESYGVTVEADTILGAEETSFIGIYYKPAAGDSTYLIVGNEVRRAGSCGISVEYGSPGTALIEDNLVTDEGYDAGTVGAYFYTSGATMRGTTVEEKSYGVIALVEKVTPVRVPDLGRYETGQECENRFVANGQYHIYTDIVSPDTLKAEQNWYGSASPSSGKFSAQVDWHPYLDRDPWLSGRRVVPGSGADPRPAVVELGPGRPNPFGRGARLAYGVPERCHVRLRVYSAAGREVAVLAEGERDAGLYDLAWDGVSSDGVWLPSGVYFVRLEACGDVRLTKLVLLK